MVFTEVIVISTPAYHRLVVTEKSGDIAYKLNRPYSYTLYYLAAHCGEFAIRFVTNLAIGAVFAYLTMGPLQVRGLSWLGDHLVFSSYGAYISDELLVGSVGFWFEDNRPFSGSEQAGFHLRWYVRPRGGLPSGIEDRLIPASPCAMRIGSRHASWWILTMPFSGKCSYTSSYGPILSLITAAMFQKGCAESMLTEAKRVTKFVLQYFSANLQSAMEYRGAFLSQIIFMFVNNIMLLFFWWVLFSKLSR